jgi:O-antigen/teichoic acid export membrane protein
LGRVFGQAAGTTTLGALAFVSRRNAFRNVTFSGVRKASVRYHKFPLYSSWAGLLNTGGSQGPPILFAAFYSAGAAGLYMLAHRVIAMPMTLVGSAIADVFMPNAVEAVREARLKDSVASLQRQLAWIAMPPAAILFVAAPDAFHIAFGADWEQAGQMVRWLTPMLFLQFIVSPLSRIFVALERQRLALILQANLFLLRLGSLVAAGYLAINLVDAVFWYGIASCIGFGAYVVAISIVSGNSLGAFIKSWLLCIPWLIIVLVPLLGIYYLKGPGLGLIQVLSLVISIIILIFYYKQAFSWS